MIRVAPTRGSSFVEYPDATSFRTTTSGELVIVANNETIAKFPPGEWARVEKERK